MNWLEFFLLMAYYENSLEIFFSSFMNIFCNFELSKVIVMRKPNLQILSLPIGLILLAIAIVVQQYVPSNGNIDFFVGLLFGLAIILNIYYIYCKAKKLKKTE
jgi:hypothetical protein